MTRQNPDLLNEHVQYNPINRVTGLFDTHDALTSTVRSLEEAGVACESATGIDPTEFLPRWLHPRKAA